MGSPMSPVVANTFMGTLAKSALETFSQTPRVWFRSVDHDFSIIKGKEVERYVDHPNNQDRPIKFTAEVEKGG